MDALTLRTSLETILVDCLGRYTFANGATTPAFRVLSDAESTPNYTKVAGIEGVLLQEPEPEPVPSYVDQGAFLLWTLFLIDWENSGALFSACLAVLAQYPGTTINRVNVPEGQGPQAQRRLVIRTRT